jgi:hypothetical protein
MTAEMAWPPHPLCHREHIARHHPLTKASQVIGSQIGRITPASAIRVYPLPLAFSEPFGITAGPDGNLWFTEGGTERIARASTWLADLGVGER